MTYYLGPLVFMAAALVVTLWVAGVIPGPVARQIVIGLGVSFAVGICVDIFRAMVRARRRHRALPRTVVPAYFLGTAEGFIREGDLVKWDTKTCRVKKVTSLADAPDGEIQ